MEEIYAYPRDTLNIAADGENTVMDTWDDLADAGLDACLLAEVCDVFATLSDDYASVLSTDKSTESEQLLRRNGRGLRADVAIL